MVVKEIWLQGKYYLGLLLAARLGVWLVRAEESQNWITAEASLVAILLLLALMAWDWWKAHHQGPPLSGDAGVYDRATDKVLVCVGIGFTALVLNANRWEHWKYGVVAKAIGYGAMIAGAFFIAGALLGYLFGLRPISASKGQSGSSPPPPPTNLEEIADWLTKLILGAGLVELTSLRVPVYQFAAFMAQGVDPVPAAGEKQISLGSPEIALAIMGFFSAAGLLYGYLWTRYQHALKECPAPPAISNSAEDVIRDRAA